MKSNSLPQEVKQFSKLFNSVFIVRKIIVEGCKSTNASEFKKVGESKGKLKIGSIDNVNVVLGRND